MTDTLIRIILDILVILTIIVGILWKAVKGKKKNCDDQVKPSNPGPNLEMIPGHSKECIERGESITKLEANYEFVVGTVDRIEKKVDCIWKHLNPKDKGG